MCERVVDEIPKLSKYVPDQFVTPKVFEDLDDNDIIIWCNGYKQRKAKKAQIKNRHYL